MTFRTVVRYFRDEEILLGVGALMAAALVATGRVPLAGLPRIVDSNLLFVLFALLISVRIIRESRLLERVVRSVVIPFSTRRGLAFALVGITGFTAALVTNDVALFVVIPFTIFAGRVATFPVRDVVILEIVACNLLGCLTPLGNPQNLYLFHQAGWPAGRFVLTMLPFVLCCAAGIAIAIVVRVSNDALRIAMGPAPEIVWSRGIAGIVCLSLVVLEVSRVVPGWVPAVAAGVAALFFLRSGISKVDLTIVPLFFVVFILVAGLRSFDVYRLFRALTESRLGLYLTTIGLSQVISNVPATVLIAPTAANQWKLLALAANAGGSGTIISSLANLLGWRIYRKECGTDPLFFRQLTVTSTLFLAWGALAGWLLLQV